MINGDAFQIEGKWISRRTGNIIVVSNYVTDGDNSIVMTNKGGINMQDFMNEYVQYDESNKESLEEITKPKTNNNSNVKPSTTIFDQEYVIDDDVFIPQTKPDNTKQISSTVQISTNNNKSIIDKFFNKIESKPTIDINMVWNDFPKNEISTLINFLDVDIKDIAEYIQKNIFSADNIIDNITKILEEKIKNDE